MFFFHAPGLHTPDTLRTIGEHAEHALTQALFLGSNAFDRAIGWNSDLTPHADTVTNDLLHVMDSLPDERRQAFIAAMRDAHCLPVDFDEPTA